MRPHPALEAAFYDELRKIALDQSTVSTGMSTLQGGLSAPGGLRGKLRGAAGALGKNITKNVFGAGTKQATNAMSSLGKMTKMAEDSQLPPNMVEDEEGNPAVRVLGANIEKLDDKRARGVPIVQAPPGYVYDPELSAFKPNSEDPAWLTEPEAMQAQQTQQAFAAGQATATQGMAQQEADNAAASTMAQQQQAMMQQAAAQQQAQQAQQQQAAAQQQAAPTPPSPQGVVGDHPMAQGSQKPQTVKPKTPRPNSTNSIAR